MIDYKQVEKEFQSMPGNEKKPFIADEIKAPDGFVSLSLHILEQISNYFIKELAMY